MADLLGILRDRPSAAPKVVLFLIVAILARLGARRAIAAGDYTTWLRDDSSRLPVAGAAGAAGLRQATSQETTGQAPASGRRS